MRTIALAALLAGCLLSSASAATAKRPSYGKTPYPVLKGSKYLPRKSMSYGDERGATKAWAFATRVPFDKVVSFYRKRMAARAAAESEGPEMYFAASKRSEIRVERLDDEWSVVYMALRVMPEAKDPPPESARDSGGGDEVRDGGEGGEGAEKKSVGFQLPEGAPPLPDLPGGLPPFPGGGYNVEGGGQGEGYENGPGEAGKTSSQPTESGYSGPADRDPDVSDAYRDPAGAPPPASGGGGPPQQSPQLPADDVGRRRP